MFIPNLDMDAIRTLVAIVQLGSLSRAAQRVRRSQSAVSQQMRKLEVLIGQPLFRKQGRSLVLTEAGDMVHSYARRILDLNDEAVHAVRGAAMEGVVRFGLPGDFAESWLPNALGQFKKAHPAVRVDIAVDRNGALLERLDRGELDLALVMGYAQRPDAEHLVTLPMTWIGPAGVDKVLSPHAPLDLALYHSPCFFRQAGIAALDKANISWRLTFLTTSLQSLWVGVGAGLGITLRTTAGIPPQLMQLDERHGLPPLPRVEVCLHAATRDLSPALTRLKSTVMDNALAHLGVRSGKPAATTRVRSRRRQ